MEFIGSFHLFTTIQRNSGRSIMLKQSIGIYRLVLFNSLQFIFKSWFIWSNHKKTSRLAIRILRHTSSSLSSTHQNHEVYLSSISNIENIVHFSHLIKWPTMYWVYRSNYRIRTINSKQLTNFVKCVMIFDSLQTSFSINQFN